MNETPNPDVTPDGTNGATTDGSDARTQGAWEAPHADRSTLRPAYAFDGSGPYLYAPDGSGPYAYTHDGRGPYLVGSPALGQCLGGSVGPVGSHAATPTATRAATRPTTRRDGVRFTVGSSSEGVSIA